MSKAELWRRPGVSSLNLLQGKPDMPDLMTAHGRALILRRIEPSLRRLEADIERQSKPIIRSLGNVDNSTWAKIGGGVVAATALVAAVTILARALSAPASKPASDRVSAPKKRIDAPAPTNAQGYKSSARATA
jgi:hypothetical protein